MKMGKLTLSLMVFLLFLSCKTLDQKENTFSCELLDEPITQMYIDVLGNIYVVNKSNRLKLFDPKFQLLFEYYNNRYGNISHIDVSNPRKLLVFFKDFQHMEYLDNTLSELYQTEIEYNLPFDIRAVGNSRDNKLWIYDAQDYRLKKIDTDGKVLLSSNPIDSYLNIKSDPDYILELNNEVFLVEEGKGILVFDNFGNFLNQILLDGITAVRNFRDMIAFVQEHKFVLLERQNKLKENRVIQDLPHQVSIAQWNDTILYFIENGCLKKKSLTN